MPEHVFTSMQIVSINADMHDNPILRKQLTPLESRFRQYPVVALLGARQVGKSTLAKLIAPERLLYLDLERTSDLNKLTDPEAYFVANTDKLICLDEIQRLPDIFPLLRSLVDASGRNGQFLLLGSASRDLLRQSSETLAGRISFLELSPFSLEELPESDWQRHWLRGGYPRSFLADDDAASYQWRQDYIRTFLERDIPQIGFNIPANSLGRLWRMLAHVSGQTLNNAKLADSMGVSANTVRHYIDLLEQTFVLRTLPPYSGNLKKRLVKSPKVYIRDSGLLHALLEIETRDHLFGNPAYGASFEGYVVENLLAALPNWRASFYRTSNGAELDLVLEKGQQRIAVEIKASTAPKPSRGFWQAIEDIESTANYVVGQVNEAYPLADNVQVLNLSLLLERMRAT
jgi:uncharacterized protein